MSDSIDQIIADSRRSPLLRILPEMDNCGAEVIDDSGVVGPMGRPFQANATTGNYSSEEAAKADFISHIRDDHWTVTQEVTGEVVQPKLGCSSRGVRADYVLWPKPVLVQAGWCVGPICVEVKRSDYPLGRVLGQAADYMRCAFSGPDGLIFIPQFCVVFPLRRVTEAVQSLMSSHRVGHSHIGADGGLRIYLNGQTAYTQSGGVFLKAAMRSARKFGSRSR